MSQDQIKVQKDSQDRKSEAWNELLAYVEETRLSGCTEFRPSNDFPGEYWQHIRSLPAEMGLLKDVKCLHLYGSNLTRFPQEIGEMESLEELNPYTSYRLRWFPYELTRCSNLKSSRVSTRALFGNKKNKKGFPDLTNNPVEYHGGNKCSICNAPEGDQRFEQYWISCRVATDVLPLLAIVCSDECLQQLIPSAEGYITGPHKGGLNNNK